MLSSDWRLLVRRWYVLLVGVLVTAGLAFGAATAVPPSYEVTANVLMLPPRSLGEDGNVTNPYLELGGLEGMADVVCRALTDRSEAEAMVASGQVGTYTMIRDPAAAAPVILMTINSDTAEHALGVQRYLLNRIPEVLRTTQEKSSVRPGAFIASQPITEDQNAAAVTKSRTRALMVAVVFGLALTIFSAALLDGLLRSRNNPARGPRLSRVTSRRPAAGGPPGPTGPAGPAGPTDPAADPYPASLLADSTPDRQSGTGMPGNRGGPPSAPGAPRNPLTDIPQMPGAMPPPTMPGLPTSPGRPQTPQRDPQRDPQQDPRADHDPRSKDVAWW